MELDRQAAALTRPAETAFIGGGTPTVLGDDLFGQLISAVGSLCGPETEFTVEANPNSLSERTLASMAAGGVNRLSIGVQSFVDEELAFLGRRHDAKGARGAIARAEAAGFANLTIDLIYGLPGQDLAHWRRSLESAIDTPVQHISCYCLSIEPDTPMGRDLADGRFSPADDEHQRRCYDLAIDLLDDAGLAQYEISNFARSGRQCRHNLTYWRNASYVGVGPSAVSYVAGSRVANTPSLAEYVQRVRADADPSDGAERLTGRMLMAETLMLGLRLRAGIDRAGFAGRFGTDPSEAFPASLEQYNRLGILEITQDTIALTRNGLFVSDSVFADIIAEADPGQRSAPPSRPTA